MLAGFGVLIVVRVGRLMWLLGGCVFDSIAAWGAMDGGGEGVTSGVRLCLPEARHCSRHINRRDKYLGWYL